MMGYLFNQRLQHCRIQSLLRDPEASNTGYIHIAPQRLPTGTVRRCQKYPGAPRWLPIAHPLEKGKRKKLLRLPHSPQPLPYPFCPLPPKWLHMTSTQNNPAAHIAEANVQNSPTLRPPAQTVCEMANCHLKDGDEVRGGLQSQFKLTGSSFGLRAVRKDSE